MQIICIKSEYLIWNISMCKQMIIDKSKKCHFKKQIATLKI